MKTIDPKDSHSGTSPKIRSSELFSQESTEDELAGVHINGIHYYDLKNIMTLSNTSIASIIDLIKHLLEKGIEVKFVNVNESIKRKICSMGLDGIVNYS